MKLNENLGVEAPPVVSRRRAILGGLSLLALAGCSGRVDRTIRLPGVQSTETTILPENSKINEWAEQHPAIRRDLELGINRLRNAEASDNETSRDTAEFEALLAQGQASLSVPNNPNILDQHANAKNHFEGKIEAGKYGLFLDGFSKELYIINSELDAVRQLKVTTGAAGFGNQQGSGQTPLGAKTVRSLAQGRLNEVVSHNSVPGCTRGNLLDSFQQGQSASACIVTEYVAIDHGRGIGFHGTNYELDRAGNPKINRAASGGCIRCYNVDIAAIIATGFIQVKMPVFIVGPGQASSNPAPIETGTGEITLEAPANETAQAPTPGNTPINSGSLDTPNEWVNSGSLD